MTKLVGNFYYNRTVNGNLLGEFTNNLDDRILSESCNPSEPDTLPNDFIGRYNSSWQQNTDTFGFTLEIQTHPNTPTKFKLIWRNNATPVYFGEAFRVGEMLVGFYTDDRNLLRWGSATT